MKFVNNQNLYTMKKFLRFSILLLMIPAFVLTSCKDDTDDLIPERETDAEFQTLITYLQNNNLDLNNILDGWITPASDIKDNLSDYYIIDIRKADAYAISHIPGAVNCAYGNVITQAANAAGKTIIVVCYTGQTAGHAVCALRLSGYPTAKVLKWGMSGWHTSTDSWSSKTATLDHANWIASPGSIVEHTTEYADPDITTTGTGAEILAARVTALLSLSGLRGVTAETGDNPGALDAPGEYFINNYWTAENVTEYGNISGAYRINPLTLAGEEYIYLDPNEDIVTYCWTGQTSSVITAYLYVLGYDSYSLKFGANSMIHDDLNYGKWDATKITDLPTE